MQNSVVSKLERATASVAWKVDTIISSFFIIILLYIRINVGPLWFRLKELCLAINFGEQLRQQHLFTVWHWQANCVRIPTTFCTQFFVGSTFHELSLFENSSR